MVRERTVAATGTYEVRLGEPADHERFLALYEDVSGRSRSEAWFDWRFESTPYASDVELVVAERDGTLVGAELLLPMPLAVGSERVVARQPVNWIVHPDHRRRGVFARMTELLLATYGDRAELLFNFPTDALLPGLEQFDWSTVSRQPTRYRIQNPRRVTDAAGAIDSPVVNVIERVCASAMEAGLDAVDLLTPTPSAASVERVDGCATDAITRVYGETRPDRVHVPREAAFVNWRYANPRWDVATYVARRDGRPAATVVVATTAKPYASVAYLLDVQPMTSVPERASAFAAALDAALADLDVDAVQAPTDPYPDVLRRRGFLCDGSRLVAGVSRPVAHAVKSLRDCERFECDVFDGENWQLLLGDRDIE